MAKKILYNVNNTSNDKPEKSNEWIDALEKTLNKPIPDKENKVGGHMSSKPNQTGPDATETIAPLTQDENSLDSSKPIEVDEDFTAEYSEVKKN